MVLSIMVVLVTWKLAVAGPHKEVVEIRTFKTDLGWGYEVLISRKTVVYQPFIPALEGVKGFDSDEDANKVARQVADKILQQQSPTINRDDLAGLGIIMR